jgi:predicted RNase H-like HicB family nuclease
MRKVILHPIEDGWWLADVPSLPGCATQGETREEAIENIKDAIEGYVAVLEEKGLPVPDEWEEFEVVTV